MRFWGKCKNKPLTSGSISPLLHVLMRPFVRPHKECKKKALFRYVMKWDGVFCNCHMKVDERKYQWKKNGLNWSNFGEIMGIRSWRRYIKLWVRSKASLRVIELWAVVAKNLHGHGMVNWKCHEWPTCQLSCEWYLAASEDFHKVLEASLLLGISV